MEQAFFKSGEKPFFEGKGYTKGRVAYLFWEMFSHAGAAGNTAQRILSCFTVL